MTQDALVVGIDVSKATLDVAILPTGETFQVGNDQAGWRELISRLRRRAVAVVAFEATGGYERGLLKALNKARLPAARVNPCRIRDFAKASGVLAKTDRLDALMIARFAQSLPPRLTQPDPATQILTELVTTRRQISDDITRVSNQAAQATAAVVKRVFQRRLRGLKAELKLLDMEIVKAIAADETLAHKDALMRTAPSVGPVVSATMLALMPELGKIDNRAVAALVGVAPFAHDSGKLKGQRCIWGGREAVRNALYMAALSAIRTTKAPFRAFYKRLIANGKEPKVALVAVMRKIAITHNAMIKADQPWKSTLEANMA